ncbi:hypothetical protein AC249_AIPGENE6839, partial [Exaiptasia diaphana]
KKWFKERLHYNECKSSCKLLMKLYNTDGGKKHKHLLPDTPKGLNSTLVASKKKTTMTRVTWSYSIPQNSVLFMIETRYYTEKTFHVSEWEFLLTLSHFHAKAQIFQDEVIATEESTTNESSTTEDENTEQLALGAHNSSKHRAQLTSIFLETKRSILYFTNTDFVVPEL